MIGVDACNTVNSLWERPESVMVPGTCHAIISWKERGNGGREGGRGEGEGGRGEERVNLVRQRRHS